MMPNSLMTRFLARGISRSCRSDEALKECIEGDTDLAKQIFADVRSGWSCARWCVTPLCCTTGILAPARSAHIKDAWRTQTSFIGNLWFEPRLGQIHFSFTVRAMQVRSMELATQLVWGNGG